jgi:hypothetical protein
MHGNIDLYKLIIIVVIEYKKKIGIIDGYEHIFQQSGKIGVLIRKIVE